MKAIRALWRQKALRQATLIAALFTPLAFIMLRPAAHKSVKYLFWSINVSHWPTYAKSWLPLDVLESFVALTAATYLFFRYVGSTQQSMTSQDDQRETVGEVRGIAMFFVGIGCVGAWLFSATLGWLFGLEAFFVVGAAVCAFVGVIMGLMYSIAEVIAPRIAESFRKIWPNFRQSPINPGRWLRRYLNPPQEHETTEQHDIGDHNETSS